MRVIRLNQVDRLAQGSRFLKIEKWRSQSDQLYSELIASYALLYRAFPAKFVIFYQNYLRNLEKKNLLNQSQQNILIIKSSLIEYLIELCVHEVQNLPIRIPGHNPVLLGSKYLEFLQHWYSFLSRFATYTYHIIQMYVADTFLSFVDKLPVRSVLAGRTGSCFGLFSTAGFIIASFIIFIWPVIYYFKGDYIQGTFLSTKSQGLQLYTGCDFKLAIFFYQKATGNLVNHAQTKQFLRTRILYTSPDRISYYAEVEPCSADYFAEMTDKPHNFKPEDCFIAPNGLGYYSKMVDGWLSVFGFKFEPVCHDPFLCTYLIEANSSLSARRMQFFKDHYFVLRFTSQYVNDQGQLKFKFYESYSTEWDGQSITLPFMWTVLQTEKIFLDNSIMPWINNETKTFSTWLGLTSGQGVSDIGLLTFGSFAMITSTSIQRVYFRQYKKLDWLLGMLGGGLLALYLIFWVVSNFISTLKQKKQNCESTILLRDDIDNTLKNPEFSLLWYPLTMIPYKFSCFQKYNRQMEASEKMLDIAELVKKEKIARKNLQAAKIKVNFQARVLRFQEDQVKENFTPEQVKYEIEQEAIAKLRENTQTPEVYSNNFSMLALYKNDGENEQVSKKMFSIEQNQKYSRYKKPSFQQKPRFEKLSKIGNFFSSAIEFFDVFGAKPQLVAPPERNSVFSCLLTLLVLLCSILTFALTLKNMDVVKTYWDEIYVKPEHQKLSMKTGDTLRSIVCFPGAAFTGGIVIGNNRRVDVKFYQYKRDKNGEEYEYHDVIPMVYEKNQYFDKNDPMYQDVNLTYCMRPENGIESQIYGDAHSDQEAYVGFKIIPYCFGTAAYCSSIRATTYSNFFSFLNDYSITTYMTDAKYYPDVQKILYAPAATILVDDSASLNFTRSVQHSLVGNTLQLIDDSPAWIMGDYPEPEQQIFTGSFETASSRFISVDSAEPYYRLKFILSGRVIRVIFSTYKIDFLFATIGGCFAFFYFFFSSFAKAYNNYKVKAKVAEVLYHEELPFSAGIKQFFKWLKIPFSVCRDDVIKKIQSDLDCTNIAKNVDNVYRLSAFHHTDPLHKDLSLIYLKERIKIDDEILIQKNEVEEDEEEDNDDDFMTEWEIQKKVLSRSKYQSNAIQNSEVISATISQKEHEIHPEITEYEDVKEIVPTVRSIQKCGKPIRSFDMFGNNSQLTLDGRRTVKSLCGGFCCIILFIFICVLVSHFLTVYFSDFNRISINKVVDQKSQSRKMKFNVGENFKLALSFEKLDNFEFSNVSSIASDVGMSVIKYKVTKTNGYNAQTTSEVINLQKCSPNYLDNFTHSFDHGIYYSQIGNCYCLPDGVQLNLYGSTDDDIRQYFSLKIYNKYLSQNATYGFIKVAQLLSNYIPRYHLSTPMVDYRSKGHLLYQMMTRVRNKQYLPTTSATYNTTIVKNVIKFDTSILASTEIPSIDSYQIRGEINGFSNIVTDTINKYYEVNFYPEESYNEYTVKKIKANQIFGIVGGCIAFLFFGLGYLPRTFNEFRMRYLIGTKVYTIMGKKKASKKTPKEKKEKGKVKERKFNDSSQYELRQELSDWGIFLAWVQSYFANCTRNYSGYNSIKRYALIESRISKDINLFNFMKNLYACQSAINRQMPFLTYNGVNLCRVYPKQAVFIQGDDDSSEEFKKVIKGEEELVYLTREHQFTEWELHALIQAKEARISQENLKKIFVGRWFDKFMNVSEAHVSSHIVEQQLDRSDMKDSRNKLSSDAHLKEKQMEL